MTLFSCTRPGPRSNTRSPFRLIYRYTRYSIPLLDALLHLQQKGPSPTNKGPAKCAKSNKGSPSHWPAHGAHSPFGFSAC
ncbi:Uncharacterized protein HZ326_12884 [Fusarium oxysporum f. sp. albedinis]|nr:Uncharacterized protein HZ326_12884 [Fusarium oxysporum f. sp. albedinis]